MTPFAILGLEEDAGLVEIKRAYARLLKATRPDEDPVAFQRLEEAYAHCIAVARGRQQAAVRAALAGAPHETGAGHDEQPVSAAVESAADPVALPAHFPRELVDRTASADHAAVSARREPTALPAPEALSELLGQIAHAAAQLAGDEFEGWLDANEALFALEVQMQVARALPAYVIAHPSAFDAFYLRLVYDFLVGIDTSRNPFGDPNLVRAWAHAHAKTEFAEALVLFRAGDLNPYEKLALAELLDAPDPLRRAFLRRFPYARGEVEAMQVALERLDPEHGRAAVRPEAAAFWSSIPYTPRGLQHLEPLSWVAGPMAIFALLLVRVRGFALPWFGWLALGSVIAGMAFLIAGRFAAHALLQRPQVALPPRDAGRDLAGTWTCLFAIPAVLASLAQAAWPASGFDAVPLAIVAGVVGGGVLAMAGRIRFEMLLLYVALTYALLRALSPILDAQRPASGASAGLAFASAALAAFFVDRANARWRGLTVVQARQSPNLLAWMIAVVVGAVAWVV